MQEYFSPSSSSHMTCLRQHAELWLPSCGMGLEVESSLNKVFIFFLGGGYLVFSTPNPKPYQPQNTLNPKP